VYAVVVSLAEMIAYQPNIGGPVGLADVYVDRALGFAMGWNAWYHWTITLPAELSAAAIIASFYIPHTDDYDAIVKKWHKVTISTMLFCAVFINCLGRYGEFETVFATMKICTIILLSKHNYVREMSHLEVEYSHCWNIDRYHTTRHEVIGFTS